jgi:hypothetical protein
MGVIAELWQEETKIISINVDPFGDIDGIKFFKVVNKKEKEHKYKGKKMTECNDKVITPAESARKKSEEAIKEAKNKEDSFIFEESRELYNTARSSIDMAAENGEFEIMLCMRYEGYHEDRNNKKKIAEIVKNKLIDDGFNSRVSENMAIKEVLLCVDWK